jgi:hypothetical protein
MPFENPFVRDSEKPKIFSFSDLVSNLSSLEDVFTDCAITALIEDDPMSKPQTIS